MDNKTNVLAEEMVNAVKENLLKPMYMGINKCTHESKNELLSFLKELDVKISILQSQQTSLIEALKSVKWD
jgi:hypothetical protein